MNSYQVIYVDVLFTINLIMNYIILMITAKAGYFPTNKMRFLVAAIVGSIFSLGIMHIYEYSYMGILKLLFSVIIVRVAFDFINLRRFLYVLAYFYLSSFIMGGTIFGSIYFFNNIGFSFDNSHIVEGAASINFSWLIIGSGLSLLLLSKIIAHMKKNITQGQNKMSVTIDVDNKQITVNALVDTGNQLKDPITGMPVIIVEFSALKDLLPPIILKSYENNYEPDITDFFAEKTEYTTWNSRIRVIPFTSIGKSNGILIGFKPDSLTLTHKGIKKEVKKAIVCVHQRQLCSDGSYGALLHPELAQ